MDDAFKDRMVEKIKQRKRNKKKPVVPKYEIAASVAKTKANKISRVAEWADHDKILEFYKEAHKLTQGTGIKHHVDHIVPLKGKYVNGLHVENNLQVITGSDNRSKHNKYEVLGREEITTK